MSDYPSIRLDGLLATSSSAAPDRPAVVTPDGPITFAELQAAAARWAGALRNSLGAAPGSVVAVNAVLDPRFAIGYFGALRAGCVVAVLNPFLPGHVAARLLSTVDAKVALLSSGVAAGLPEVPGLRRVVIEDAGGGEPTMSELMADAEPANERPSADLGETACVHFTSGTTGEPKAVLLSHRNLVVNAAQIADAHRLAPGSVTANHLPTYHPMHLNSAVFAGVPQVLCPADPAAAVELAARNAVTHFYSLPVRLSQLARDTRLPTLRLPTLRVIASGGSALPPESAAVLGAHFGVPVIQGYGLAETSPLTHSDVFDAPKPGSVGPPVADTECRIVDVTTRQVRATGETGEIQVRGPQLMTGYLDPAQPGVGPDGWFDTGDVGRIDADGYLFLVDRIKDIFKCDNWLVSPASVECELRQRPEVGDCCVVDAADADSGAVAAALIVPSRPDLPVEDVRAAVATANGRLAYYERIRDFRVVPEIPRANNGKISRAQLRERFFPTTTAGGSKMVTLVNKFVVTGDPEAFEKIWRSSSEFMRTQPGFISFRLVRSLTDRNVYINIAQWETAESHQRVVRESGFQQHIADLAAVAEAEPHLCQPVIEHAAA